MRKVKSIKSGKVFIDNQACTEIDNIVVTERQTLADCGLLLVVAFVGKAEQKLLKDTQITSLGIINPKDEKSFSKEIEGALELHLKNLKPEVLNNTRTLDNDLRNMLRKLLFKKTKKYPTIVVHTYIK